MKISKYTYLFESSKNDYLLYNSITNSFAKINRELFYLLTSAIKNPDKLIDLELTILDELKKAKVVIDSELEEQNYFYQKRMIYYSHMFSTDYLQLTIAPTTKCNFACPYCYEEGIKHKTMTDITIENLITFIKQNRNKFGLILTWYGGEPLLVPEIIDKIILKINEEKIPIHYNSMITNGYFLNKKNQEFLLKHNFQNIQVTLDGAKAETHDTRRYCKNGKGSWDIILNNLDQLLSLNSNIKIDVRCNIDNNNKLEFFNLKELLEKRWGTNKNVLIYPGFLQNTNDLIKNRCQFMTGEDITNFHIEFGKNKAKRLYFHFDSTTCGASCLNSFVVGPSGELYKCWNDLGCNDKIIGSVNDQTISNPNILAQYLGGPTSLDDEECRDCVLFFVCNGGCPWMRIKNKIENQSYYLCNYKKNNINKFLEMHYENKKK